MENVKPSIRRTVTEQMKKVTICAHDEAGTRIQHLGGASGYVVCNDRGLFIEHGNNLHRAMGDLYAVTGIEGEDYTIITEIWV